MRRELERAELCAVVKADGYGHGAVPAARAALAGGATWLAVAAAHEAAELRDAGIADVPILVLGALSPGELDVALAAGADVVAWREELVAAVAAARRRAGAREARHGDGPARARATPRRRCASRRRLRPRRGVDLVGAMTHFATADEPDDDFFGEQLARFAPWAADMRAAHPGIVVHAANSAATLRDPASHFDLVRTGIALYGLDPFGEDPALRDLRPALRAVAPASRP